MQNSDVRILGLLLALGNIGFAQSGSVVNAADVAQSFSNSVASSSLSSAVGPTELAPGSLAIINTFAAASSRPDGMNATVSVRSVGAATPIAAQVVALDLNTITFVVPKETPIGPAQLIYREQGDVTKWIEIAVVPARFALFRSSMPGPARAQVINPDGTASLNGLAAPAKPGRVVVLWGSGLGATPLSDISVSLGGVTQTLLYAGRSGSLPGIDQINFQVTAGAPDGCYVPLTVNYGRVSTTSFLSKSSDGSPCAHPWQLSATDLRNLDFGGAIKAGLINLSSSLAAVSADHASRQESASVVFQDLRAADIAAYFAAAPSAFGCSLPAATGTSAVFGRIGNPFPSSSSFNNQMTLTSGSRSLSFSPPLYSAPLTISADTPFSAVPPPLIAGGQWMWSASGGSLLPASSFTFTLASPMQIKGPAVLNFASADDQIVTWDGAGYGAGAVVTAKLTGPGLTFLGGAALLTCAAPARDGALVIPKSLLSRISATAATLNVSVNEALSEASHAQFRLANGDTLLILVNPASTDSRPVDIQ